MTNFEQAEKALKNMGFMVYKTVKDVHDLAESCQKLLDELVCGHYNELHAVYKHKLTENEEEVIKLFFRYHLTLNEARQLCGVLHNLYDDAVLFGDIIYTDDV